MTEHFLTFGPSELVTEVVLNLTLHDLLRIATASRGIWSRFRLDTILWRAVGRAKLAKFVPARAWYDGPWNPSMTMLKRRRPRVRFPSCGAITDTCVATAIADSGPTYAGCEWTWNEAPVCFFDGKYARMGGPDGGEQVEEGLYPSHTCWVLGIAAPHCRIPDAATGPTSPAEFGALASAFRCGECPETAFAQRQCASCGMLLCMDCAIRCDYDGLLNPRFVPELARNLSAHELQRISSGNDVAHCAFALCSDCHESYSLVDERPSRDDVLEMDGSEPGLALTVCHLCDPRTLCPAHVQCCILACEGCGKAYCADGAQHCSCPYPRIDFCQRCHRGTCINQPHAQQRSCEEAAGFSMNWCSSCSSGACSDCTADFTGPCPYCNETAGFHFH